MKETLQLLVELQELEDALRSLTNMKARLDSLRVENTESKSVFERMLTEREEQLKEVEAFCKEKSREIEEAEGNARRARTRLSGIQSQRELTALNKELDTARRMNQAKSEELKKLKAQLETSETDYNRKKEEFGTLIEVMETTETDMTATIDELESNATDQRARQAEIRGQLDRGTVAHFDRIMRGRDGHAVVGMTSQICTACRVSVSPQVYIRLQIGETLETCSSCQRILIWNNKEATEQQLEQEQA